jgi:signal transduction histidine kinase
MAIMVSAWYGGLRAGMFATILSGILLNSFFIAPSRQLIGQWDDLVRVGFFVVEGYIVSWLVASRTEAAEEIKNSREQLLALSLRQQTMLEEERKRIALEIHDELGQALTGLKMQIHLLNRQLGEIDGNGTARLAGAEQKTKDLLNLIDTTIASVRRIATELRPPILDDLGLVAAIEWQSQEFEKRTGIRCTLATNIENIEADSEFATAVFRIFQETLTNSARHSDAKNVLVTLKKTGGSLLLRVEDDGKGISNRAALGGGSRSLGILGMRERARLINGDLQVFNGSEEGGTVVLLDAPLGKGENNHKDD